MAEEGGHKNQLPPRHIFPTCKIFLHHHPFSRGWTSQHILNFIFIFANFLQTSTLNIKDIFINKNFNIKKQTILKKITGFHHWSNSFRFPQTSHCWTPQCTCRTWWPALWIKCTSLILVPYLVVHCTSLYTYFSGGPVISCTLYFAVLVLYSWSCT